MNAYPRQQNTTPKAINRRSFFETTGRGLYGAALAYLFNRDLFGGSGLFANEAVSSGVPASPSIYDLRPKAPHFEPKAKSVIHLFMNGGPSQMDLFDPKPELDKNHGKSYFQ